MEQIKQTATVTLNGKAQTCPVGTALGDLMQSHGHGHMPCGGHGKCGKCRVTVTGEVSDPTEDEKRALTPDELARGVRLACRVTVLGDCTVATAAEQGRGQIVTHGAFPVSMQGKEIVPSWGGYGVAIDIGTTTLAARLYDRAGKLLSETSRLNPQSAWGADVISRMEAAMAGNAGEIARKIAAITRRALDGMLTELATAAEVDTAAVQAVVITGNTVMLHLLTETNVEPLTHAPFAAERLFGELLTARDLGLTALPPDAAVYLPPCIAAFIGADTVTATLASDLREIPETALLCDIGTNGEMVLWHENTLYACSTAAGPAFEGAGISMGMSGRVGAIDRVWVTDGEIQAHVIGEADPVGLCGSGLVDAVAALLDTELLDETGYLEDDPAVISAPVEIIQEDIRAVQLAKSAIHAGMRTLIHTAKLDCDDVDTLYIAGGFGSYLDVKNAGKIGLLPEELTDRVTVLGNAALTGAAMLLLCEELRPACEKLAKETRIVELAANPVFVSEYMERMMF